MRSEPCSLSPLSHFDGKHLPLRVRSLSHIQLTSHEVAVGINAWAAAQLNWPVCSTAPAVPPPPPSENFKGATGAAPSRKCERFANQEGGKRRGGGGIVMVCRWKKKGGPNRQSSVRDSQLWGPIGLGDVEGGCRVPACRLKGALGVRLVTEVSLALCSRWASC